MEKLKSLMAMPKHSYEHIESSKPLPAVEVISNAGKLLDKYRDAYKARHGNEPVILNTVDAGLIMSNLSNKVGFTRAMELVEHFLNMDPSTVWFLKDGHSLATFKNKIEEINASLSIKTKHHVPNGAGFDPTVSFETYCGNVQCKAPITVICQASKMQEHSYADLCLKCELAQGAQ